MWIKLDDAMLDNRKVAAAGPIGFALHVAGIIYSARNLTDGFIPYGHARRLLATDWTEGEELRIWQLSACCGMHGESGDEVIEHMIPLLCELGLWESVPHGYRIHDYLEYNPSRGEVLAMRAERQESGRRGGLASAQAKARKQALAEALPQAKSKQNSTPHPVPVPVVENLTKCVGLVVDNRGFRGDDMESTGKIIERIRVLTAQRRECADRGCG